MNRADEIHRRQAHGQRQTQTIFQFHMHAYKPTRSEK
jgi:hypothetical protein